MARVTVRLPKPHNKPKATVMARSVLRFWAKTALHKAVQRRRVFNSFIEGLGKRLLESQEPDGFARQVQPMKPILTAASLGLADAGPVGGPIEGAWKAILLDKAFQEIEIVVVLLLPVGADAPLHLAQEMAAQMGQANPR